MDKTNKSSYRLTKFELGVVTNVSKTRYASKRRSNISDASENCLITALLAATTFDAICDI